MSAYHLHARLFVGSLDDPIRNELQSGETDRLDDALVLARELVDRGFSVWIYEHDGSRPCTPDGKRPWTVVLELRPEATGAR